MSPAIALPALALPFLTYGRDWSRQRVQLCYFWAHGRWPELDRPRRFTEWVQWRKLNDRNAALSRLTDKAYSKSFAAQRVGASLIVPTLWQGHQLPPAPRWPYPFMVKANHGCGSFVVVRKPADYARARRLAPSWLAKSYGGWLDEHHYLSARPMLLVEPFLGGEGAALPFDYKVYVFGGHAEIVQLHVGRGGGHRWTQFDRDWTPLSRNPIVSARPALLEDMLRAAETLAAGQDFLRVDFYVVGGRLYFGEFCLYPGSGLDPFEAEGLDVRLGECWRAARAYSPSSGRLSSASSVSALSASIASAASRAANSAAIAASAVPASSVGDASG